MKAIAAEIREHDASVTTDDIKKKINTLRLGVNPRKLNFHKSQELGVRMFILVKFNTYYIAHYSVIL